MLSYRFETTPDDNGTLLVTSPDFPEVTSFGETEAEASLQAVLAIEEAIAGRIDMQQEVPSPVTVPAAADSREKLALMPISTALKVCLYRLLKERSMQGTDLARALGWPAEHGTRLLRLDDRSPVDDFEAAFKFLGSAIAFEIRSAVAA